MASAACRAAVSLAGLLVVVTIRNRRTCPAVVVYST
jgi:hypothetical protein